MGKCPGKKYHGIFNIRHGLIHAWMMMAIMKNKTFNKNWKCPGKKIIESLTYDMV